jgi:outer membrane receptor protein involved in Fe transport
MAHLTHASCCIEVREAPAAQGHTKMFAARRAFRVRKVLPCSLAILFFSFAILFGTPLKALSDGPNAVPDSGTLRGVVRDQSGAPVALAEVEVHAGGRDYVQRTGSDGTFAFHDLGATTGVLSAKADGFAPVERTWTTSQPPGDALDIELRPATVLQQTVIVASRTEALAGDVGASVSTITPEELRFTAALTLDDVLGQVPGFNLFRRSDSRTANPTTQGVSLRGTGGSGASRAVVLDDGIPLEDPFGGWVQWSRVPRASVDRIELVQGGISDLYGSNGLGGAISVVRQPIRESALRVETSYGNERTPDATVAGSILLGQWAASATGDVFSTDGFRIVNPADRGLVDIPANSEHRTGDITLERLLKNNSRVFVRASDFGENRGNGTPVQINRTALKQLAAGVDWQSEQAGNFSVRAYGGTQRYSQTFSSIATDRNSESLTNSQFVPTVETGATAQWSRAFGLRQVMVAGIDAHDVRGDTRETVFVSGNALRSTDAGGHQRDVGMFVEDMVRATQKLFVTAALRYDNWRNFDPVSRSTTLATGNTVLTPLNGQNESAFSPRLGLNYKLTERVAVNASGYRSFRGPTLNELYRSFRVGNVITQANAALHAERANGFEAGTSVNAIDQRLVLRGTVFWTEIDQPVSNVTLSVTPALITRQRQNLGRIGAPGFELASDVRVKKNLSVSAGYQFVDATVASFPADPTLVGLFVPQVPRQQFTFQTAYNASRWTVAFQGRAVGVQFDDDQNLLPLRSFFVLDGFVSRQLTHSLQGFVAVENALNQQYDVSRTPVLTIGPPALVRVGMRFDWARK